MQAITLNVEGIKCDNPGCDFQDRSVKLEEYKEWLNKPCPKCGANLLTRTDLVAVAALGIFVDLFNFDVPDDASMKRVPIAVEMDGTGQVSFRCKR